MRAGRDHAADGPVEADGRALARRLGRVYATVHGLLKETGLRPHPVKTFTVSRDPRFAITVRDGVGLTVDPPDHAVVLSVDAKTQIQARGRTQRPLPMKPGQPGQPGHAETRTHDYRRNGTPGRRGPRHRHRQGRRPDGRTAPLGGVPRRPRPCRRGDRARNPGAGHPRHRRVAPVGRGPRGAEGPSRLDGPLHPDLGVPDERRRGFFSKRARQRLKNAVFDSLDACIAAIAGYIEHPNANDARPFRWSRKPEDLVKAWKSGHQKLEMASNE